MAMPTLPKPMSQRPTGMPQMRRRSGLRTASGNLQEAFLERVRAVRDDPAIVLPTVPDGVEEPRELARLRDGLAKAKAGKLGFFARRDKGVLGAAWACRKLAEKDSAPRLLDARIDGERRFYWPVGHVRKPACLGVQNWDEPTALLVAYDQMAEAGLHFFAGDDLACTGRRAVLLPDWLAALGKRLGTSLEPDDAGARCPHAADRAALAHVLPGASAQERGPAIRLCSDCLPADAGQAFAARLRNPGGRRPFTLEVALPDGTRREVSADADAFYRVGRREGRAVVAEAVAAWHAGLHGRFAIGDRLFPSQDAFLDELEAPAWMRPALAAMTAPGHAAPPMSLADLLARHRARLADGVQALGADPAVVARRGANADDGAVLRLAHEQAARDAKTSDLPPLPAGAGPLASWIDGFVRSRRTDGDALALAKVRREAARLQHKAHVAAFLAAAGADPAMGTGFSHDTKEAGLGLAPVARPVLEASGPAYLDALRAYLAASGSGEAV